MNPVLNEKLMEMRAILEGKPKAKPAKKPKVEAAPAPDTSVQEEFHRVSALLDARWEGLSEGQATTSWKPVVKMTPDEVADLARSLANQAEMCRLHGDGINTKESVRFRAAMQRIKDEHLIDDRGQTDLWTQWLGQRGGR